MRRKYDLRNKKSFLMIAFLSIIVVCIFSLFIYRYNKASKIEYLIEAGTIIQDIDKNSVSVSASAKLKIRWNGKYYLIYQDQKIELGKEVIAYNSLTRAIKLYGTFYEIQSNGKIVVNKDETIVKNVNDTKFYKIDDREYLLIDKTITNTDRTIEANNYLLVELDKQGNAKLSNNKLQLKTISETTLVTSKYTFDIANEKLNYGKYDIDLKKIIGSSNQYVKESENSSDTDKNGGNGKGNGQGTGGGDNQGNGQGTGGITVNNGTGGLTMMENTEDGNMITYSDTTTSDAIFYQPAPFVGYPHVQGLYPKKECGHNWNEDSYLYLITCFRKCASGRFDYATKFTRVIASSMEMYLPIKSNQIDIESMANYIKALKKQILSKLSSMFIKADTKETCESMPFICDTISNNRRFTTHLPVFPLRAACGYFDECGKLQDEDAEGWIDASDLGRTLNDKMFVIHAEGDSMEPKIHDGELCVFDASGAGSREGKIVLCKARDKSDRNVSSFTIKKYHSEKIANEDGWMHSKITLSPLNSNYNPIIISAEEAEEDEFKIYGEFICVI